MAKRPPEAGEPQWARIDLKSLPHAESMLFRVGVASGWKTVATLKNPYRGPVDGIFGTRREGGNISQGCGVMLDGTPEVFWQFSPGKYRRVKIVPQHIDNSISRRVVAFDAAGHEVQLPGEYRMDLDPKVFCKIDKFVLQTSEVEWAEFRDVPIKPGLE